MSPSDDSSTFRDLLQRTAERHGDLAEQMAEAMAGVLGDRAPQEGLLTAARLYLRAAHEPVSAELRDGVRAVGSEQARRGVGFIDLLAAYRAGMHRVWQIAGRDERGRTVDAESLARSAANAWTLHDRYVRELEAGYREQASSSMLRDRDEQSSLVDAIVHSSPEDADRLWEAIDRLGLPRDGSFVVVVALTERPGDTPLPRIHQALDRRSLPSAWLLRSNMQVGLVALTGPDALDGLVDEVADAGATVGVSDPAEDWTTAPRVFRFAAAAARASRRGTVTRFRSAPVRVLVGAAPDIAEQVAHDVLGPVLALPDGGGPLLDTVRAWFAADGSTADAAQSLYLHANTVRNRLHRFESLAGRSLDRPGDAAAVAVALAALDRA